MNAMSQHANDKQHTAFQTQSNSLKKKIMAWIDIEHLYIPAVATVRQRESEESNASEDNLRIEWCKSKARADRWHEEIRLILAEMSRIKLFFLAMADQWAARTGVQICTGSYDDVATAAGRDAYAASQAAMYRSMSSYCASIWRHVPDFVALGYGRVIPIEIQSYEDGINEVEEVGTIDGTEDTM
ncbi:hypothetical protein H0H92_014024 [Tricholoma furcatifolium]|nr:hypothetical protein H0H92_014024 [Tricholoma furcatifolium]